MAWCEFLGGGLLVGFSIIKNSIKLYVRNALYEVTNVAARKLISNLRVIF